MAENRTERPKPMFDDLARLEPRLADLLAEAQGYGRDRNPDFCANAVWYGYAGHQPGLRSRLTKLVGWESGHGGLLGSSLAYDIAYDTIEAALPDCRGHCACSGEPPDVLDGPADAGNEKNNHTKGAM
jgi:hypothetical protein